MSNYLQYDNIMDNNYKNNLTIKFNNMVINYGSTLDKSITKIKPLLNFAWEKNKFYTIIMIDPDAPNASNPKYKYWLHWLIINKTTDLHVYDIINDYEGPSPPDKSGPHRYYICVFEQDNWIAPMSKFTRANFNIGNFVSENKLKILGCFKFIVVG